MIRRFLRLKVSVPVAALALVGGGFVLLQPAQAYTPPAFDDALTFPVDTRGFKRLGVTSWACGGGCVAARAGGAARRGCVLYKQDGPVSGLMRAASDDCVVWVQAACTGAAVDDCASGERL